MNASTRPVTASSATRSDGSRRRLVTGPCSRSLEAYRGLPELQNAVLVRRGPVAVVVDHLDRGERRRAGSRRDVGADRDAVAEPDVQLAGLLREDPVDERLRGHRVLRALDDADGADLVTGALRDRELDARVLRLLREDVVRP